MRNSTLTVALIILVLYACKNPQKYEPYAYLKTKKDSLFVINMGFYSISHIIMGNVAAEPARHIEAVYRFEKLNRRSELTYYNKNYWEEQGHSIEIK
ncbi:hypothetical protein ACI6Q2_19320 [Chitinophagaceae bacterium LWZ2-11]